MCFFLNPLIFSAVKQTQCPPGYQDELSNSDYCFKEVNEKETWNSAEQKCRDAGGDLVCFSTEEERDFWKTKCDGCWVGYTWIDSMIMFYFLFLILRFVYITIGA